MPPAETVESPRPVRGKVRNCAVSHENVPHDVPVHIRLPEVAALEAVGEPFVWL